MGACLSSSRSGDCGSSRRRKPPANVVSIGGELRQYSIPVAVSEVLQSQTLSPDSFFICSSDQLYFGDYIPSLNPNDELESAQIYFILPIEKLEYRLSASDMAALAVKASAALDRINASDHRRRRNTRISPVSASDDDDDQDRQSNRTVNNRIVMIDSISDRSKNNNNNAVKPPAVLGASRSGSVRKMTRYSSRRAKLAVRSFRNKLTTISEGSALPIYG